MDPDGEFANYVKAGSLEVVKAMIASGMSAEQAKALGNSRIFGGAVLFCLKDSRRKTIRIILPFFTPEKTTFCHLNISFISNGL